MKVIINASNIHVGGGTQVTLSFIHFLAKFREHQFHIFASQKIYSQIDQDLLPSDTEITKVDFGIKEWFKGKSSEMLKLEAKINPDAVFTIFGPSYWTPKSKHLMGFALPWLINPESAAFGELAKSTLIKKRIQNFSKGYFIKKNADFFVVETEDVKNRLNKYFNVKLKNTWVADNTYNQYFNGVKVLKPRTNKVFKFITITANYPHKNLRILREVIPTLMKRGVKVSFTLTIPHEDFTTLFGEGNEYINNLGPVTSKDCPEHYNKSDALFLPTLLECFTASYPEAMIMQRPILTSDLPFARQICGDGNALFFDPLNANDIADQIENLVNDEALYNGLVKNGLKRVKEFLSSEQRADAYISILKVITVKD